MEKDQKYSATTIYIDQETSKLVKEVKEYSGRPIVQLFREFLIQKKASLSGAEHIPIIIANDNRFEIDIKSLEETAKAPLELAPGSLQDPFNFNSWISLDRTVHAILVGTSMRRAIVHHYEFWQRFIEADKPLRVLIQGDLQHEQGSPKYTYMHELNALIVENRTATLAALTELSKTAKQDVLEVRNSGSSLISYSAIFIYKIDGTVDIQIQPYLFFKDRVERGARFILNVRVDGDTYRLLFNPINNLWLSSIQELRSCG